MNENEIGNFDPVIDINKNHYSSLRYNKRNGIPNEDLMKIKKIIC